MPLGADTQTHTHTHTNTRTKVIIKNQACAVELGKAITSTEYFKHTNIKLQVRFSGFIKFTQTWLK